MAEPPSASRTFWLSRSRLTPAVTTTSPFARPSLIDHAIGLVARDHDRLEHEFDRFPSRPPTRPACRPCRTGRRPGSTTHGAVEPLQRPTTLRAEPHLLGRRPSASPSPDRCASSDRRSARSRAPRRRRRSSGWLSSETASSGRSLDPSVAEHGFGDRKHRVLLVRRGELDDHLAAADHLAGLGADGGDDAVELGVQLGVAQLVPRKLQRRLGRIRAWPRSSAGSSAPSRR